MDTNSEDNKYEYEYGSDVPVSVNSEGRTISYSDYNTKGDVEKNGNSN